MRIESHILDVDGKCSRCGMTLNGILLHKIVRSEVGTRIGVISELRFSEPGAYIIEKPENDSNKLCRVRDSIP